VLFRSRFKKQKYSVLTQDASTILEK